MNLFLRRVATAKESIVREQFLKLDEESGEESGGDLEASGVRWLEGLIGPWIEARV